MRLIDADKLPFEQYENAGGHTELAVSIDAVNEMPTVLKWNMFPENKPQKDGRYLVTVTDEDNRKHVITMVYSWGRFSRPVDAWAKLPEAFVRTEDD